MTSFLGKNMDKKDTLRESVRKCSGVFINLKNKRLFLPFPDPETLIITRAHKASVLIYECDAIHGTQMAIIFLCDLTSTSVPLKMQIYQIIIVLANARVVGNWGHTVLVCWT